MKVKKVSWLGKGKGTVEETGCVKEDSAWSDGGVSSWCDESDKSESERVRRYQDI